MNAYKAMLRRQLLEEMYDSLSEDDKRTFIQLTMQEKNWDKLAHALQRQENQIEDIHENVSKQTWVSDFSSNLAGNAVWDGLLWIGKSLFRKL